MRPYSATRRFFLKQGGTLAAALALGTDLQAFVPARPSFSVGCSAITWGGNDKQAIADIAALGLRGIQLRANSYKEHGAKPGVLKAMLRQHRLKLAMFSSGNLDIDPALEQTQRDTHTAHARFVKALGGTALQITNSSRPAGRPPTADELKRFAALLTEVGKRTAGLGVQAVYHNHMHQLGETPEEVDMIMQHVDTRYVKLLLDIAHYWQGGGDPAKAARQYKDILHTLHIKDVKRPHPQQPDDPKSYQFVSLGQGQLDLPAFFTTLRDINFKGWAVIELDSAPDASRTPMQFNGLSRDYLQTTLGLRF